VTADNILKAWGLLGAVDASTPEQRARAEEAFVEQRELAAWIAGMKQLAEDVEVLGMKDVEGQRQGGKVRAAAQMADMAKRRSAVRHMFYGDPNGPANNTVIAKTPAAKPLSERTITIVSSKLAEAGFTVKRSTVVNDIKAVTKDFGSSAS
jgi:hypothetical protein